MRAGRRQAARGSVGCLLAVAMLVLAGCTESARVQTVTLSLAQVPSCALGTADTLQVTALGDFTSEPVALAPGRPEVVFDEFPFATRALGVAGAFDQAQAFALTQVDARARAGEPLAALLLPHGRSCPLGDPLAFARTGAVLCALAWGGALIAGGIGDDGLAVSTAMVLPAGAALVEQVQDGMLLRRAFASATAVGEVVLVAGGAADERGGAHDTYEVLERASGTFARGRSRRLLGGPRMRHGAAVLSDGRVLLVGGHAQADGAPLASAELVVPQTGEGSEAAGELIVARIAPTVLVLDGGQVLVLGGRDERGAPVLVVEVFDAETTRFRALDVQLPEHDEQVFAPLAGARVAMLGCDAADGEVGSCELGVLFAARAASGELSRETVALDFATHTPAGLRNVRLLSLADGRLLVTGEQPGATIGRRAFVLDPSLATIEPRDASRVPTKLVALADGSVAELDAFGASLRREDSRSRYDVPRGNLVGEPLRFVVLDSPGHWRRSGEALRAQTDDAALELPTLRFADVRVSLRSEGEVTLVLRADDGRAELFAVRDGAIEGCGSPGDGEALIVTRRGGKVSVGDGGGRTLCTRTMFDANANVAIAVRASATTRVSELRIDRL